MQELVFYFGKELVKQSGSLTLLVEKEKQMASSRSVNEETQDFPAFPCNFQIFDTLIFFKPFGFCETNGSFCSH
jgi:hypothetical protein